MAVNSDNVILPSGMNLSSFADMSCLMMTELKGASEPIFYISSTISGTLNSDSTYSDESLGTFSTNYNTSAISFNDDTIVFNDTNFVYLIATSHEISRSDTSATSKVYERFSYYANSKWNALTQTTRVHTFSSDTDTDCFVNLWVMKPQTTWKSVKLEWTANSQWNVSREQYMAIIAIPLSEK